MSVPSGLKATELTPVKRGGKFDWKNRTWFPLVICQILSPSLWPEARNLPSELIAMGYEGLSELEKMRGSVGLHSDKGR
jgi:hypothetical protein